MRHLVKHDVTGVAGRGCVSIIHLSCHPLQAVESKRKAEDISAVLYPNDATDYGKELRLKQQVFFVSASIQVLT